VLASRARSRTSDPTATTTTTTPNPEFDHARVIEVVAWSHGRPARNFDHEDIAGDGPSSAPHAGNRVDNCTFNAKRTRLRDPSTHDRQFPDPPRRNDQRADLTDPTEQPIRPPRRLPRHQTWTSIMPT
jgi:hypothetical protein